MSVNGPLPVGTHLLLGGVIIGSHGAKILGVRAVKIPGVVGVTSSENKERGGVCTKCTLIRRKEIAEFHVFWDSLYSVYS